MTVSVNPPHWFGMPRPDNHPGPCWGARAIYRFESGPKRVKSGRTWTTSCVTTAAIEGVWNRQQMVGGTDDERATLEDWINRVGLPYMHERFAREKPDPRSREVFVHQTEGYQMIASPNGSHGYVYFGAWPILVLTGGKPSEDMTLHEVLASIGWTSHAGSPGRRDVIDADGTHLGRLSAGEIWQLLRDRGLKS